MDVDLSCDWVSAKLRVRNADCALFFGSGLSWSEPSVQESVLGKPQVFPITLQTGSGKSMVSALHRSIWYFNYDALLEEILVAPHHGGAIPGSQNQLVERIAHSAHGREFLAFWSGVVRSGSDAVISAARDLRKFLWKQARKLLPRKKRVTHSPPSSVRSESEKEKFWPLLMVFKNH